MFERFNNSFQNTVMVPNTNFSPYQDQYFGQSDRIPYVQGLSQMLPQPMPGNLTEQNLYPLESSLATPYLNTAVGNTYKHGGKVKNKKGSSLPSMAEKIRKRGRNGDTMLAHINPLEAAILKSMGGSGTINPETGLHEFAFWNKPFKAIKSWLGGGAGALIGNAILPGIGGIIGGALGGGVQNKLRGKSFGEGALRGATIGGVLPSLSSGAGWAASKLGANTLGSSLTNYGNNNSILSALGMGGGNTKGSSLGNSSGLSSLISGAGTQNTGTLPTLTSNVGNTNNLSFWDKLSNNTSDYLSSPQNLLTLGVVGSSFLNRPKKETPTSRAKAEKEYQRALMLNPEELREKEAQELALAQMRRRVERNKFLPEERFAVEPLYARSNTPEEYRRTGRWLNYYNNPDFSGEPLVMKKGGRAKSKGMFEMAEVEYPTGIGRYIAGQTKGQDDKIPAVLSDGEFVIPADIVSDIGDGNNEAGANELYKFMSNVRKHKRGGKVDLPPKAKGLASYMKGGKSCRK